MGARKKSTWSGEVDPPELPDDPDQPPADLSAPVDLEDTEVSGFDWSGTTGLSLTVERTRIARSAFTGCSFEKVHLVDCELVDCELSGATFQRLHANRVVFSNCRMMGLVLLDSTLQDVRVDGCRLDEATLRIKEGRYVAFTGCDLSHAMLQDIALSGARFEGCDLSRTDVTGARFADVRLVGGVVEGLRGIRHLRGVTVSTDLALPLSMALLVESGISVAPSDVD